MTVPDAVIGFCRLLNVSPPHRMPLRLRFERNGRVVIAAAVQSDAVTLTLERPLPAWRTGVLAAVLRAVHPDRDLPHPVRVGCRGGAHLMLTLRLEPELLEPRTLDAGLRLLCRLADDAEVAADAPLRVAGMPEGAFR